MAYVSGVNDGGVEEGGRLESVSPNAEQMAAMRQRTRNSVPPLMTKTRRQLRAWRPVTGVLRDAEDTMYRGVIWYGCGGGCDGTTAGRAYCAWLAWLAIRLSSRRTTATLEGLVLAFSWT